MHKLIIIFTPQVDMEAFQSRWQTFLSLAEKMPGLRREVISQVQQTLVGGKDGPVEMIHELFFDSRQALDEALESPLGQAAGQWLQRFAGGQVTILISEHLEAGEGDFKKNGDADSASPSG